MNTNINDDYATNVGKALIDMVRIVEILRSPEGCPWDVQQTHISLREHFLEEAYETIEAIDNNNPDALLEELGDILIHVLFHSDIARRSKRFDLLEVIQGATYKLKRRHPHVFGNLKYSSVEEVEQNWEKTKRSEQGRHSILKNLPKGMPSLLSALSVLKRVEQAGIQLDKVKSNINLNAILNHAVPLESQESAGELLLQVAISIYKSGIEPETALRMSVEKLRKNIQSIEQQLGKALDEVDNKQLQQIVRDYFTNE